MALTAEQTARLSANDELVEYLTDLRQQMNDIIAKALNATVSESERLRYLGQIEICKTILRDFDLERRLV